MKRVTNRQLEKKDRQHHESQRRGSGRLPFGSQHPPWEDDVGGGGDDSHREENTALGWYVDSRLRFSSLNLAT